MGTNICVYFHRKKQTNEIFYVGIGNIKRPYVKQSRSTWWHKTVKKYGYIIEIVYRDISIEEAKSFEIMYIKKFGRKDLGLGNLINMTDGGEGTLGRKVSKESRLKSSKSNLGQKRSEETKNKLGKHRKDVKHTAEVIDKIIEAGKARKGEIHKKPLGCISKYQGVTWDKERGKWIVRIKIYGKAIYIGRFVSEIEAAQNYDKAAKKHLGIKAILNFEVI